MRLLMGALLVGLGLMSGAAMAQTAAEREACKADYEKFCAGVLPGGGRPLACLAKQADKLTPECKAVVDAHAPKLQRRGAAQAALTLYCARCAAGAEMPA